MNGTKHIAAIILGAALMTGTLFLGCVVSSSPGDVKESSNSGGTPSEPEESSDPGDDSIRYFIDE